MLTSLTLYLNWSTVGRVLELTSVTLVHDRTLRMHARKATTTTTTTKAKENVYRQIQLEDLDSFYALEACK